MDIHEIQIDDYVMFDGSVYQVEEISKKGWVHLTQDGNRVSLSSDYILSCLEGVPLTREILEKNGFKQDGGLNISPDYTLKCNESTIYVTLKATTDKKPCISAWNRKKGTNIQLLCKKAGYGKEYKHFFFVHELQQLLRLAGCEKEIII